MASTLRSVCLEALRAPAGATLALQPVAEDALRARAPRLLTSGETLDFRTLVPQPGGLFDYKVFGPGTVIDAPAVDLDAPARPPKTHFARLVLPTPLVHPLAIVHAAEAVAVLANAATAHDATSPKARAWTADGVRDCRTGDPKRSGLAELAAALDASDEGRAFVLRELPVLPPDLRPLTRLEDDRWQTSPINELYRHVMRRTQRLAAAIESGAPPEQVNADLAGVHLALEHLFENEDCAEPLRDVHGEPFTSLRGLTGGTAGLFAALAAITSGVPVTGRIHRASAVLLALGFELAS